MSNIYAEILERVERGEALTLAEFARLADSLAQG